MLEHENKHLCANVKKKLSTLKIEPLY